MHRVLLPIFLLIGCQTFAQTPPLSDYLKTIVEFSEANSLFAERVEWETFRPKMAEMGKSLETYEDLGKAVSVLLEALGDEHGRLFGPKGQLAYYFGDPKPHQEGFDQVLMQMFSANNFPFRAELLENNTGYLRIVSVPMGDNTALAAEIQDEVCRLMEEGANKWVIDLRYNTGNNLNPMVEGLAALYEENEYLGGAQGLEERQNVVWEMQDGDFYNRGYSIQLEESCRAQKLPKIAVLTSLYTASSGEALAITFKGREDTRFFGAKTLGMVSGNDFLSLNDSVFFTLAINYFQDRHHKVYREYVDVDEEIEFIPSEDLENDPAIRRAMAWLKEK